MDDVVTNGGIQGGLCFANGIGGGSVAILDRLASAAQGVRELRANRTVARRAADVLPSALLCGDGNGHRYLSAAEIS